MAAWLLALLALCASCARHGIVPATKSTAIKAAPSKPKAEEPKKPAETMHSAPPSFPPYDADITSFFMDECMEVELSTPSYCACVLMQLHDLRIPPAQVRSMVKARNAPLRVQNAAKRCESKLKH